MEYFYSVSLIAGILIFAGGVWLLAAPGAYRKLARPMLKEKRASWFVVASVAWAVWVVYTWIRFMEVPTATALALSFILTLPLIKCYFLVFRYADFRNFAFKFLDLDNAMLRVFGLIYLGAGAALWALGAQ